MMDHNSLRLNLQLLVLESLVIYLMVIDLMVVVYHLVQTILQYMSIEDSHIDSTIQQVVGTHLKLDFQMVDLQSQV